MATLEASGNRKSPDHRIPPIVRNIAAGTVLTVAAVGAAVVGVRGLGGEPKTSANNAGATSSAPKQETPPQTSPELSLKAQDFALKSIDGQTVRLSDYKGKPVIIFYWGEPNGPDETKMQDLTNSIINLAAENKERGVVLLTIAMDARDTKTIAGKTSPILIDDPKNPNQALRGYFSTYPAVVFVKPDGTFTEEIDIRKEVAFLQGKIQALPQK